jgi:hypothetical protein
MLSNSAEAQGGKGPQPATPSTRAPRENGAAQQAAPPARYFLAKPGTNGVTPAIDRECPTEAEAIAEAFRAGISYYAVTEYRAFVDCSGKQPVFKKEVVKKTS